MTISVVIPVYNEENFLGDCLDSLMRQTRPADEIIVVDNNSTDGTAALARRYKATVISETTQGIKPAAYKGFMASSGDIIARCDADSILPEDWLSQIEKTFQERPGIVGLTGPANFYGANAFTASLAQVWYMYAYFILVGSALANWPLFGSNCAVRRSAWLGIQHKVHRTRTDIHDDIDISIHFTPQQRIAFMPALRVRISARSLQASGLLSRYNKGFTSLMIHWPADAPWRRWMNKIRQ